MPSPLRNVLIMLTDQHRASAAGYRGDPLASTPNLDRLARRAAVFTAAHTPAPVCVPARQSLITGRYPHAHGAIGNGRALNQGEVTLGHLATAHGMASGAIGKMHFVGPERRHGFDVRWDYDDYAQVQPLAAGDMASGMAYKDRYGIRSPGRTLPTLPDTNPLDRAYLAGPSPFPAEAHVESYITRESTRFLEDHRDERFLLICSFFKPHDPLLPPAPYWDLYADRAIPLPDRDSPTDPPEALSLKRRRLGVESFGDIDIFPTVAEALGLELPPHRHGVSLLGLMRGDSRAARDHVCSELPAPEGAFYGVRTADWKLALYEPGKAHLFDLRTDPEERRNVYDREPQRVAELRQMLEHDLALK